MVCIPQLTATRTSTAHSSLLTLITLALSSVMSMPSTPMSPHECPSCHHPISPQQCNSNGNGNCGCIFLSCYHQLNTGTYCKYFKWLSDPLPAGTSSCSMSHSTLGSTLGSTSPTSLSSGDGAP